MVKTDGDGVLLEPCNRGDGASCFMLGSLYYGGQGVSRNLERAAALFQQSCTAGFTRGCGQIGESYLFGEGVPKDIVKARQILESACGAGYGPACFNVGIMHRQGIETPKNESLAERVSARDVAWAIGKRARRWRRQPPLSVWLQRPEGQGWPLPSRRFMIRSTVIWLHDSQPPAGQRT